jgi:hypothetical protein
VLKVRGSALEANMNAKKAKALRRALRRMAPAHWPERAYVTLPEGYDRLIPGSRRGLYKIMKTISKSEGVPK